jgi:hypothetical protein
VTCGVRRGHAGFRLLGTDFQRFFELAGKRLTLKPPAARDSDGESVQSAITWERLSN